ncbi:MAG: cyclic nucleotide-binding domain-containing protein [Gemmatimonadota bacterium]
MEASGTLVMMSRQHGDRWSSFGEHTGIRSISSLPTPAQLKKIGILQEFDDDLLKELSPDLSLAEWNAGAVIFEQGSYLDLAFLVVSGEVEVFLARPESAVQPIFGSGAGAVAGEAPYEADRESHSGGTVMLASMDFDVAADECMRLGPGELFGEIGAMNGWPQSATARTASACTLLQIRLPALRKLRRKSRALRIRLDELYKARMLRQHLAGTPLLHGCTPETLERLVAAAELVSCEPGEVAVREGEPTEHFVLVRSGCLRLSQALGAAEVAVSYLSKGDSLGESELMVDGSGVWQVSASSVGNSELVRIGRDAFLDALAAQPELEQRLWGTAMERIKIMGATRSDLARSDLLDFTLAKGIAQANSVLVIDLEACTRCDDCVRGCASTHGGRPRFVREGEVYDGFMVARSCYHCQDPTCLVGCPTGAIRRLNVGAVVEIDPAICIGCGACEQNCPYDSIVMHDLDTSWGPDAVPSYLRGQPRAVASKCDLCYQAPEGPACVASCPHSAAHRVSGTEEFDLLRQAKRAAEMPV